MVPEDPSRKGLSCEVFSATMNKDRKELGPAVTQFLRELDLRGCELEEIETFQSSDSNFHCLSMVVWYYES